MKRLLLVSSLVLAISAFGATSFAVEMQDQSTSFSILGNIFGSAVIGELPSIPFDQNLAQTFTVGLTGQLTRLEFFLLIDGAPTAPINLDIRPTTPFGIPDRTAASVRAVATIGPLSASGFHSFDLRAANLFVTPGQVLAMVLSSTQDFSGNVNEYVGVAGPNFEFGTETRYAGGEAWLQMNGGPWNQSPFGGVDWGFRTFVNVTVAWPAGLALFAAGAAGMWINGARRASRRGLHDLGQS